jgi:predicted NBD/HSP70 family sugar kinase
MNKSLRWRILAILGVIAVCAWAIYPPSQTVRLGLDLKGGVHLILRVQTDDALRLETETAMERLREEMVKGADFRSLAALSLGHSVGLGIVRRGNQTGQEISAPNFGHMLHMANGGLCRCGTRGCIEAYAGFYAILRSAFEVPLDTIPAKFVPVAELDKIAAKARQGHRVPAFAFRQAGLALGNGLSRMLSLTERMPIAITGPGTRYYDLLRQGIEEGLGQSHIVRMEGMPEIRVVADEQILVFEGHLNRALSVIDEDIVLSGVQGAQASATIQESG